MFWLFMTILTIILVGVDVLRRVERPAGAPPAQGWCYQPLLALWPALWFTKELLTVNATQFRHIPWGYLGMGALLWWGLFLILAAVQFIPVVHSWVTHHIGLWIKHAVPFWKEDNTPFLTALTFAMLSIFTFFLQGLPKWGPDAAEIADWSVTREAVDNVKGVGNWLTGQGGIPLMERAFGRDSPPATVTAQPLLPRYPRTWWWLVAAAVSTLLLPLLALFNFRDESADFFRGLMETVRLRKGVPEVQVAASAAPPAKGTAAEKPAEAAVAPPTPERGGVFHWVGQFLTHFVANLAETYVTHRRRGS